MRLGWTAAALLCLVPAGPALAEDADEEMEALKEAEEQAILGLEEAFLRGAHRLAPGHPLRGRLLRDRGVWDLFDPGGIGAPTGALPFPVEAVAAKYDIPLAYNEAVAEYIAFFTGPGRRWFSVWLERERRFAPLFREILREHGVPEDLVYLAMIESGFSTRAVSHAKAVGPWQFIEATGKRYGLRVDFWVDERRDPVKSTHAAARFLKALHEIWGDWYLAWAGYNAGPGRVSRGIREHETQDFWELAATPGVFRKETRHYVPKLLAAALIAKHPEHFGFETIASQQRFDWEEVELPDATDLDLVARLTGVSTSLLREYNPELSQWATPPVMKGQAPYRLRVPRGKAEGFAVAYSEVPASQRFTFRSYQVQKGDTLGHIAQMFRTSTSELMRSNRINDPRRLRIGQMLMIPIPPGTPLPAGARRPSPGAPAKPAAAPASGDHHVLAAGETLSEVAVRYGVSVEQLQRLNDIQDPRRLRAGTRLRIR